MPLASGHVFIAGWWLYTYPSEKSEFVTWDDELPNQIGKYNSCSKPPSRLRKSAWDPSFLPFIYWKAVPELLRQSHKPNIVPFRCLGTSNLQPLRKTRGLACLCVPSQSAHIFSPPSWLSWPIECGDLEWSESTPLSYVSAKSPDDVQLLLIRSSYTVSQWSQDYLFGDILGDLVYI